MTSLAPMQTAIGSRPKIHRLPVAPKPRWTVKRMAGLLAAHPLPSAAAALLALSLLMLLPPYGARIDNAARSQAAPPGNFLSPPIDDAVAAPSGVPSGTFVIHGENGSIIGQMAKIPTENEQITEVKPVSDIDKHSGHELLSIISKY